MPSENRHPDRLTALASGFVAAMALAVSTYNVLLQRQQIRAQTWPHLSWTYSQQDHLFFSLSNSGVGPAIVKDVLVTVDGKPVKNWSEAFTRLGLDASQFGYSSLQGKVLGPGAEQPSLHLNVKDGDAFLAAYRSGRVRVGICYCSVLDDCWELGSTDPTGSVRRCVEHAPPFEQ